MKKIASEKETVERMIGLYCRKKHGGSPLCAECSALLIYARQRLDKCPFGENKTACKHCKVHCYKEEMRQQIRTVMRYSGPRMLMHFPVAYFTNKKGPISRLIHLLFTNT